MGSDPQLQQLLAQYGLDSGSENPEEYINRLLEEYGLGPEPEEGSDIFQPIRTAFGATGNVGGQLLGLMAPEAYREASKELLSTMGYSEKSPWYEKTEALPGLGDVAANMVPDEIRESGVGKAVGPFGRIIGNILGDPTTYTPFILSKLGGVIAHAVPTVAPMLKTAAAARRARQMEVAAGALTKAAALEQDAVDAAKIYRAVQAEGSALQRLGYSAAEGLARGGDAAMATGAALAYGPEVVKAAWEGAKAIPESDTPGEAVITGVNTALMAGLSILMGKGLIDAAGAARTLAADATGRSLEVTKQQVEESVRLGEGEVERAARELPEAAIPEVRLVRDLGAEEPGGTMPPGYATRTMPPGEPATPLVRLVQDLGAEEVTPLGTDTLPFRRAPEGKLSAEDLRTLDLEAAREGLEGRMPPGEEPPAPTRVRRPEPPPAPEGEGGAAVEPPRPVESRMELEPELRPYSEFVENKDLPAALEARGLTLDQFRQMPHQDRMAALAGKREVAPTEPVKAPETPAEVSPKVEAPEGAAEGRTEAPAEPSVERAETTETEAAGKETLTSEEGTLDQQLTKFEDDFAKEGTIQKSVRSMVEGRKSRGEEGPSDPVLAAEMKVVLDDEAARRKLLNASFETGEVRDGKKVRAKLADLPPNKVYPAIRNWIKENRLKGGGAGEGARGAAGVVERATESAVGAEPKGKKALGKEVKPGAYEAAKEILDRAGYRYKQFAEALSDEWTGALRLPHNKDAFMRYIDMREKGVSRSDAIKAIAEENVAKTKNRQSIRNLIKNYEKKIDEEARARHGAAVREAAEAEGTLEAPAEAKGAKPAQVVDISNIESRWNRLKARIPSKPDGMSAEDFAAVLKQKKADVQKMLEDYYVFSDDRAQMQGLGKRYNDAVMKNLAKGLGIKVSKGVNIHWLIRKIGEKIDIPDTHWSPLLDSHRVKRAAKVEAAATRAGVFDLPNWKSRGGGKQRGVESAVQWESPNGTKLTVTDNGRQVVLDEIRSPAEAKADILSALENGSVERVIFPENIKGLGPIMDELPLVIDEKWADAHPEANVAHYRVDRSEGPVHAYEYRDLSNPYNPHEGTPYPLWTEGGDNSGANAIESVIRGPEDEALRGINNQLRANKAIQLAGRDAGGIGEEIGMGRYHRVYRLNGAKDAQGRNVVIRAGFMPWTPMVTGEQKALMPPIYGHGRLADMTSVGYPVFYTLHPEGFRVSRDFPVDLALDAKGQLYDWARRMGLTAEEGKGKSEYFVQSMHDARNAQLKMEKQLPKGVAMQDWFDDTAELFARADRADMHLNDFGTRSVFRPDQTVYIPLGKGEKVHPYSVVRTAADGNRWQLVFNDPGAARPNELSALGTPWEGMRYSEAIAQMEAEGEPPRRLTQREYSRRAIHYHEDDALGIDIGDDMRVVNHDRRATDDFVQRLSEVGQPIASALKKVTEDVVSTLNEDLKYLGSSDLFTLKFRGLSASPFLNGVYVDELVKGNAGIYVNPVPSVRRAANLGQAVDDMLYTLFHEITHDKAKYGHGDQFRDVEQYIKGLRQIQEKMEGYRQTLSEALNESRYRTLRDDLVPELTEMRRRYGRPSWGEEALLGVYSGHAPGRTPRSPYRRTGGAEAAPGGGARGVQPGGTVPGGGEVPTGRVRSPAAAGGTAAEGRPTGEGVGYGSGRGAYEETVRRVETFFADDKELNAEKAKQLLDDFVEKSGVNQPRAVLDMGWDMSTRLVNHMNDDQVAEVNARKPHGKAGDAVWNLMHNPDLPDRLRARMILWGDLTAGHRKRDTVRHWETAGEEVKDMLALDTPEAWALAFRKKGGGLRDSEVLLLREIHNELAGRVKDAEDRFSAAWATGDKAKVDSTWKTLQAAKASYYGTANKAADLVTEQARALAIMRKSVRRMDPQHAFEQDLMAGIRDRVKTRYHDPAEAEKVTRKLFQEFIDARDRSGVDPNSWGDFYKAYRTMMGSKLFPDKVIEFYKAGLLGYSSRAANIVSNGLFRAVRFVEDSVAAGLDAVGSKLTGKERDMFLGEAGVSTLAMRRAFAEAFPKWMKAQFDAFALRPEDAMKALEKGGILEDLLQHPGAIEGKFGEFVRFAFKGLSADDQLAKQISATDHMYRTIYRRLRKGELKLKEGESLVHATERIFTDMRSNYDDALKGMPFDEKKFGYFEKIFKEANDVAREDTFQKELGNLGRGVQSVLTHHPMLQVFVPFLRTPSNIAKETIKRTPLGLIEVAAKWKDMDNVQRLQALSRPLTGTALGMGVMSLAMDGSISGGGPVDPEDREALVASGWQPYSIKVGNQWISFQRLEPVAAIFGIAADAAEGLRHGDFDSWNTGAMRIMQSSAENITNKTFLAGLDGVTSAISHPNLFLPRFEKQMQGSMIPNSLGFIPVGHLARAIDPIYRAAEPMSMDVWTRKIPFLSTTVEPQYGPTGEERRRGGTAVERLLSPFQRWETREGPEALGAEEIVRLGVAPSPPRRYMYSKGGVKVQLLPEEKREFALAMRAATKVIGQRVLKDPNYLRLPDDENDPRWRYGQRTKKDVLQRLFTKYRSSVRDRVRRAVETRGRELYREQRRGMTEEAQLGGW